MSKLVFQTGPKEGLLAFPEGSPKARVPGLPSPVELKSSIHVENVDDGIYL